MKYCKRCLMPDTRPGSSLWKMESVHLVIIMKSKKTQIGIREWRNLKFYVINIETVMDLIGMIVQ